MSRYAGDEKSRMEEGAAHAGRVRGFLKTKYGKYVFYR
jgi:hypothetical protein